LLKRDVERGAERLWCCLPVPNPQVSSVPPSSPAVALAPPSRVIA
jgi:hypothetical protein